MYPELKGKCVVVTGAGGTIGRAVALRFAEAGCRVAAVDRDAARAAETCALAGSADAVSLAADLQSDGAVAELMASVHRTLSGIDILVNSHGITQAGRPYLAQADEALFDRVMAVNLKGVFLTMKHAIPGMVSRGGGCIVNVASAAGLVGQTGMAIYAASKHGVVGLTRSAALEYGPQGVRINAVCPSRQESLMAGTAKGTTTDEETREADRLKNPASGRAGRADELAATVLFLCSAGAGNIHGAAIAVDGGFTAM